MEIRIEIPPSPSSDVAGARLMVACVGVVIFIAIVLPLTMIIAGALS